ncbi:MAG: hypothetical protein WC480_04455 [Patescibacteria group bacterium]
MFEVSSTSGLTLDVRQVFYASSAIERYRTACGTVMLCVVTTGQVKVGDVLKIGDQTDEVVSLQINKADVSFARLGESVGIGLKSLSAAFVGDMLGMPQKRGGLWSGE